MRRIKHRMGHSLPADRRRSDSATGMFAYASKPVKQCCRAARPGYDAASREGAAESQPPFFVSFAHESRKLTMRLNTNLSGVLSSGSLMK